VRAAPAVAGLAGRFSKAPLAVRVAVVFLGSVLILGLFLLLWLSLQQPRRRRMAAAGVSTAGADQAAHTRPWST
jgi:phage shock protein PspC (stress-responsive transcriptional regulator)